MPGGYESKWAQVTERPEPQPRYDSYGRKVPKWEVREVTVDTEHQRPRNESTWRTWLRKDSSFTIASSATYSSDGCTEADDNKGSWWKPWTSRTGPGVDPRSNSKDEQPAGPYSPISSRVFGNVRQGWKPITVKLPVLGSIFVVTLALIVAIEVLAQRSISGGNGGGLVFAETVDDIEGSAEFSYLYLPTLLAVFYSMAWSWVDIDAKRLEPWFQLSKPEGADAKHSLLLEYPFGFLPLVPLKAARKGHWAVVMAGATMVFVAWAIVPLQAAIFALGEVTRTVSVQMVTTGALVPKEAQATALNTNFLMTAYGVAWLDQRPPPFTTKEYAIVPFAPLEEQETKDMFSGETWSTTAQMFYANLTCSPPARMNTSRDFYDSGDGCVLGMDPYNMPTEFTRRQEATRTGTYLGYLQYFDDAHISDSFQQRAAQHTINGSSTNTCDRSHWNKFLAHAWNETHETVLFCQPIYHGRTVNATVAASDNTIIGIDYDYTSSPDIVVEDIFDLIRLHRIIGTGAPNLQSTDDDKPNLETLESFARVQGMDRKYDAMVPFALSSSPFGLADFSDPAILHDAFEKAHTLVFAMAINQAMSESMGPDVANIRAGFRQDTPGAIKLDRRFAIIVEACLGAVALLTVSIYIHYRGRQSNMISDPASVSDVMMLIRTSQTLLHDFQDNGSVTDKVLEERLGGQRFRLISSFRGGLPETKLETSLPDRPFSRPLNLQDRTRTRVDGFEEYKAIRPWQMKVYAGAGIGAVVAASIAGGIFLYNKTLKEDGLQGPTDNSFVVLLITQIAPTAYAQMNEPLWLLLNRLLCVFQPFEDLRKGDATSARTLEARYTAVPPPLALFRAIKAGHLVLALICVVTISTNALAVVLGALFEESPTSVSIPTITKTKVLDGNYTLNRTNLEGGRGHYYDPYYVALSNASATGSAPLPPWQDNHYYYLPFDFPDIGDQTKTARSLQLDGYESSTTGYGIDVTCQEIISEGPTDSVKFEAPAEEIDGTLQWNITVKHQFENGSEITCASGFTMTSEAPGSAPHAAEVMAYMSTPMFNGTFPYHDYFDVSEGLNWCSTLMLAGWARIGETVPDAPVNSSRPVAANFMTCRPTFVSATFDVRTDANGRVLSSNRTSDIEKEPSNFASPQTYRELMVYVTSLVSQTGLTNGWHNDTFATDWMNSLIKADWGNGSLINPKTPLPDMQTLIPVMETMYERQFPTLMKHTIEDYMKDMPTIDHTVTAITTKTRIFMDPLMFYLSISLLGLQLIAIVFYYINRPRRFLPRMPLTIASIIAYVSASHAVHDIVGHADVKYGYGRFIGTDGVAHVGIERQSRLVPLESRNPEAPRKRWPWSGKENAAQPRTWI